MTKPEMKRSRAGGRLMLLVLLAAAIALAVMYLTCGTDFGLGGKGKGEAPRTLVSTDAGPTRCVVRVSAEGITVGGKLVTRDEAVTACKATTGADVVVTGDARQGDWDELRAALEAAGVAVYTKQR